MKPPDESEIRTDLGDARLNRRARRIAEGVSVDPADSLPNLLGDGGELDAAYRFFGNARVTRDKLLAPHRACSWGRSKSFATVLSVEDTTEVRFGGEEEREGLGMLQGGGQGFRLHAALAVGFDGTKGVPLGIVGERVVVRTKERSVNKTPSAKMRRDPNREHVRWFELAELVDEEAAKQGTTVVHVADREADDFDYLAKIANRQGRFVVRLCKARVVSKPFPDAFVPRVGRQKPLLDDVVSSATAVLQRDVHLSKQAAKNVGRKPKAKRESRVATLICKALRDVVIPHQPQAQTAGDLKMNIVEVVEENPPDGAEPIHWRLGTSEPVSTAKEIEAVIDMYRARWLIEEFWKALKTGTSLERRQLESFHALENCMALSIPLAWQMLYLRSLVRDAPSSPAAGAIPSGLLHALHFYMGDPVLNRNRFKLSSTPTLTEALNAIAHMGGHIKNNGDPGWLTLRRGFTHLVEIARIVARCAG